MSAALHELAQRAGIRIKDDAMWGSVDTLPRLIKLVAGQDAMLRELAPARAPIKRAQMLELVQRTLGREQLTGDDALLIRAVEAFHKIGGA